MGRSDAAYLVAGIAHSGRTVLASAALQVRSQASPTFLIVAFVQPVVFLLVVLLSRGRQAQVDVWNVALGAGLLSLWGTTIWQVGTVLRHERYQGTLSAVMARPCSLAAVLLGKSLGLTLRSALMIAVTVYTMSVLFGAGAMVRQPLAFAVALVAVLLSATVLGMLVSCLFVLTRSAIRIAEALTYPVYILGGLLIPLSLFPGFIRPLAELVSLYRGGELVRAAAVGGPQTPESWLLLAATTALYGIAARVLFREVLRRVREDDTLDLY